MRIVKSFNSDWYFLKDREDIPSEIPEGAQKLALPHTWNGEDGQDGGGDYLRARCLYMKRFLRDELPEGELLYIEILAAN